MLTPAAAPSCLMNARRGQNKLYSSFLDETVATQEARRKAREILQPLSTYDELQGGDLINTLRVYFACGGNGVRAAERLFLHRNGLLYRISRVEDLLGVLMSDASARLAVELAIRLVDESREPSS